MKSTENKTSSNLYDISYFIDDPKKMNALL